MKYLTIKDIQDILKISHNTAYKICALPDFPKVRFGKTIRVAEDDFFEYMRTKRGCYIQI